MERRKVFILLTRFPDAGSKVIRLCTRFFYTHTSIGLDEDMNTFYSFVTKGFIVEKVTRYLRPDRTPYPCRLYEITVSEETYQAVKAQLDAFVRRKQELSYSKLGVVLALFHVAFRREGRYFCSQFVADVLSRSRAARLQKDSALYFPRDFESLQEIQKKFQGDLEEMAVRYGLFPERSAYSEQGGASFC